MAAHRFSDSTILQGLVARRASGDESGLPAREITERFSGGRNAGEIFALEHDGLVERSSDGDQRPVLYRATVEAVDMSRGPDRPLRPYAHLLVELSDAATAPFSALEAAVNGVADCTWLSTAVPPLQAPSQVAEGWVETIVDAHEIDQDDEHAQALIADAIGALTVLVEGPRRTL